MLGFGDQLTDHGLNHADVAVQGSAKNSSCQSYPDVGSKAENYHAEHGSGASQEEDWLSANAVGKTTPEHAHHGLCQSKGRDEQAGVGGCILFVANLKSFDELPGIGEDGSESNGLSEADDSYGTISRELRLGCCEGRVYLPRRNSCNVGKSSGLRFDLCFVRLMAPEKICSVLRLSDTAL